MNEGIRMVKLLYDTYFHDDKNSRHLKEMGHMLQLIHDSCKQNFYHCVRVSNYAMMISECSNMTDKDKLYLWSASLIHDIGKLYIPSTILEKSGSLTEGEFEEIKRHPYYGYYIVHTVCHCYKISEAILHHHERYDGRGYPDGCEGKNISYLSRVLSIADAYDAMKSERVYRYKLSEKQALEELQRERGKQFDGQIVDTFLEALKTGTEG